MIRDGSTRRIPMITIELFGVPRLRAGTRSVKLDAATLRLALDALGEALPVLDGTVICEGRLHPGARSKGVQMAKMLVKFTACHINHQNIQMSDPNKDHLVSRVHFDMAVGDRRYRTSVEVRQPFGTDYLAEPLEVRLPEDAPYRGPFPHDRFAEAVETYYRRCVGERGSGSRIGVGENAVVISEMLLLVQDGPHAFEVPEVGGGWSLPGDFVRMPRGARNEEPVMAEHCRETFTDTSVVLDGQSFKECKFVGCKLIIRSEQLFAMDACTFQGVDFHMEGAADRTLQMLTAMYHGMGDGGAFVESLFDRIRRA